LAGSSAPPFGFRGFASKRSDRFQVQAPLGRSAIRHIVLGLTIALALSWPAGVSAVPGPDPYARCRERFATQPEDYDSAFCFYQVTIDSLRWKEGARVFDDLIAAHPDNLWLPLAYGHVYRSRDPKRAEQLYRRAADGFRASARADGEVLARSNLRDFLFPFGRVDEATREMERVVALGNASTDPLLKAQAWSLQARHIYESGGDLGHAFRLLKQAESACFPQGPYRLKRGTLTLLGNVAAAAGRLDEALSIFRRLDTLAMEAGDAAMQATARYNAFETTAMKQGLLPSPESREQLIGLAESALESGMAAEYELVVIRSHAALAHLFARSTEGRPAAVEHLTQCLTLATAARQAHDEAVCAWIEASLFASTDPRRARAAELRALEATARAKSPRTQAESAGRHMRHSWNTKSRAAAIRDSLAAIDSVETLRGLQDDANSSAALFSSWTFDYYWLSGRLLQDGQVDDVALGFFVTERMRARSLLDALDRSRPVPDPRHPAIKERRGLLEAIAAVQRVLMDPTLDDAPRAARLRELEELERREQEAARQITLAFHDVPRTPPTFASLDAVQSALAPNEALLSFQVGLWETYDGDYGGGSWLVAVTKNRRTVHRLPDRTRLSPVVPVFVGLLERGDARETPAAARLYKELLSDAVTSLPTEVTRLVIVADGVLHHLPFEALRATADAPPLGARYELVQTPSATLWLQWRAKAPDAATGRMLTFADPLLAGGVETEAPARDATLLQGLRLGRLPHAREESRAIERHVGGAEALVGESASEKALKSRDLRGYNVLHFAAHAVADETHPERSAVLLAPGDAVEDGLLQVREIAALDLDGRIVVLSACQTAAGVVMSGEGVLSLARAFFEAGAHAVIGSRWPLRDVDAAALFDTFYLHLGQGASLAQALKATQDEARAAGRPASAWAGLMLLGNGDLRPFPGGRPPTHRWLGLAPALVLGAAFLVVLGLVFARRSLRRSS
jgi:CHAT domain-containing protein/tetratricopeptide (TPR) repeat protein